MEQSRFVNSSTSWCFSPKVPYLLLLFCFHVVSGQRRWATTTFDSVVAVPSLSKHPDDRLVIQPALVLLYKLPQTNCFWACLHGCERVMVTRTEFHFGWVYTFFVQLSSLRNWCTLTRETSCNLTLPLTAVWIILRTSPFTCVATVVIFFEGPFNWNVSLMLACLGAPDLITVLFFSMSWHTVYYENANAMPSLSPINLLLL